MKRIDDATYHGMYDHVSASMLKALARSPAHMQAMLKEKKDSDALRMGRALHKLVLEGDEAFRDSFGMKNLSWATKEGKAQQAAFAARGLMPVSVDEWEDLEGMRDALLDHPIAGNLLMTRGHVEEAILWTDHKTGVACRCKPDKFLPNERILLDVKSTLDASTTYFERSAFSFGYHIQAAHYEAGALAYSGGSDNGDLSDNIEWLFIAVEKNPPYAVNVFAMSDALLRHGRAERLRLLNLYKECNAKNNWPSYPSEVQEISIPRWARGGIEEA